MDYNTIKEKIISFNEVSTNADEATSAGFQKTLTSEEITIVGEALSTLSGQELEDELLFLIDNVNMEDSIDEFKSMLLVHRDTLRNLVTKA